MTVEQDLADLRNAIQQQQKDIDWVKTKFAAYDTALSSIADFIEEFKRYMEQKKNY